MTMHLGEFLISNGRSAQAALAAAALAVTGGVKLRKAAAPKVAEPGAPPGSPAPDPSPSPAKRQRSTRSNRCAPCHVDAPPHSPPPARAPTRPP